MAHPAQAKFCLSVKKRFPEFFKDSLVLDIGSLDINGNNRYLFENCSYTGVDIGPGKNVDVVSKGHEYMPSTVFDVVMSTECFEHDKYWELTLHNMYRLLRPGGLLMFTCATTGRPEHGTTRSKSEWASPYSHVQFDEYYKNVTEEDVLTAMGDVGSLFRYWDFEVDKEACDLYFWGIKSPGYDGVMYCL